MEIYENNRKTTLSPRDFKASGGQGAVYVKGNTAYKLYGRVDGNGFVFAPQTMIAPGKISELSVLSLPDIIKPETVLHDKSGVPVGYTMRAVTGAMPLCQTFPQAFKNRNHLTPNVMLDLVQKLRIGVAHVHAQNVLIVDLNEMNFLVDSAFDHVYFIDVDSYQTVHFPASALMESVRDRHSSGFNTGTDWFSFGIVSFQMLVGIHPYKGKHPQLPSLDERMKQNVSVFNSAVRVPAVCAPFSDIPQAWRDWYEAVFEKGVRVAPPDGLFPVVVVSPQVTKQAGSDHFTVTQIAAFDGPVLDVVGKITLTTKSVYVGTHRICDAPPGSVLGVTDAQNVPVLGRLESGQIVLTDVQRGVEIPLGVSAAELQASQGRIYAKQESRLLQVEWIEMPTKVMASGRVVGTLLPHAAQLFDGVVVQNLLGALFVGLLPSSGFYEVRTPELDGFRVVQAKFVGGVLVAVGEKNGKYDRFVFRFAPDYKTYDVRVTCDVAYADVNFAVLDTGVAVLLNENEEIELFAKTPGSAKINAFSDRAVSSAARLFCRGAQTLIAQNGRLSEIKMR